MRLLLQYGSGAVYLEEYFDVLSLGGSTLTLKLGVATSMSDTQASLPDQGIVGLAFQSLALITTPPFFIHLNQAVRAHVDNICICS